MSDGAEDGEEDETEDRRSGEGEDFSARLRRAQPARAEGGGQEYYSACADRDQVSRRDHLEPAVDGRLRGMESEIRRDREDQRAQAGDRGDLRQDFQNHLRLGGD